MLQAWKKWLKCHFFHVYTWIFWHKYMDFLTWFGDPPRGSKPGFRPGGSILLKNVTFPMYFDHFFHASSMEKVAKKPLFSCLKHGKSGQNTWEKWLNWPKWDPQLDPPRPGGPPPQLDPPRIRVRGVPIGGWAIGDPQLDPPRIRVRGVPKGGPQLGPIGPIGDPILG